jgi:Ca2+-binding EF-hand superfamily protein
MFKALDKDGSGFLDLEESSVLAVILGRIMTDADKEKMFKDMDTNHDNKVSKEEFAKWWAC